MNDADRVGRERSLRQAVLAGSESAWQTWYDESFAALDAYVLWRCGGLRDLADDMLQETWLTAVRRVRDFDPERSNFSGWLRGIAVNVMRNSLRRRSLRFSLSLSGDVASEGSDDESRERGERIAQALANLPEHYEGLLRMKYLEEKSVDAIAAESNESSKAVESMLTRARTAFRAAYGELE
jgi:RNA polymerase sigma-70 factor (ECF subfamily)